MGLSKLVHCLLGIDEEKEFETKGSEEHHRKDIYKLSRNNGKHCHFVVYSPLIFAQIQAVLGISHDQIVASWKNSLLESKESAGKSGSSFIISSDGRFMIKTISKSERLSFRHLVKDYLSHLETYPNTLLMRILGLYKYKGKLRNHTFILFTNFFYNALPTSEKFDLKGSTKDRTAKEGSSILLDLDLKRNLYFGEAMRAAFLKQLSYDVDLLASHQLMDYSLLVGIHKMEDEPSVEIIVDGSTNEQIQTTPDSPPLPLTSFITNPTFSPVPSPPTPVNSPPTQPHKSPKLLSHIHIKSPKTPKTHKSKTGKEANLSPPTSPREKIKSSSNNVPNGPPVSPLNSPPPSPLSSPPVSPLNSPPSTPPNSPNVPLRSPSKSSSIITPETQPSTLVFNVVVSELPHKEIYYVGIIDILTNYNFEKKVANAVKRTQYSKSELSTVDAPFYAERFKSFVSSHIK